MRKIITIIAIIGVISIAAVMILSSTGEKKQTADDGRISSGDRAMGTDRVEGIEEGNEPPDFSLTLLDGTDVRLSDYRGKVVYLNFWATWCGPCVAEMPDMQTIHEKYGDQIVMLAVNVGGENHKTVSGFMEENGYTFPAGIDSDGQISGRYQISAIPATLIIDSSGLISTKKIGMMKVKGMEEAVETALDKQENR